MAYGIPLWNEETGWTPLDELPPGTLPTNSGLITGGDPWGGGQSIPSSNYMTTYQEPPVIGSPQMVSGSRNRGNRGNTPTYTPNSGAGNDAFNAVFNSGTTPRNTSTMTSMLAPTGAQVQANPQAYAGTSFDPNRTLSSGLPTGGANNMSMTGAENVGGMGMYTGSNGPINSQLFNQQAGNMQPQLDYVRNIDQVNYYKYILPLQQAGLIDISNPQQVNAAIQQGLARDGGGQWASGSKVSNVQSSPYSAFLTSGDPRAQAINQFMLSGDQNAIAAANDWMSKNIDSNGRAKTALDNIQAWSQRFDNYYFPNKQFNPNAITPGGGGGGQQTPPPGGGQQTPGPTGAENWYQEYQSQNPAQYTAYNKQLDDWAISQIDPNTRNRLKSKSDPASLNELRQLLDQVRQSKGYATWGSINQQATGNANSSWLAEGYEGSPYAPTIDPGQYFKWNWGDTDAKDPNNPMSWYLQMNAPQTYEELLAATAYYNNSLKGKGLPDSPWAVYGDDGTLAAKAAELIPFVGGSPWQTYNWTVNRFLESQLDENSPFRQNTNWQTNPQLAQQYLQQMDALRSQLGYFTNSAVQQLGTGGGSGLPLNSFINASGTPFRPNQAPGQGFRWEWLDSDGQGPKPGTWGQTLIGTPTTLQQATEYANYMNQAGSHGRMYFGGNNFSNMFSQEDLPTGGYKFTPKTSFFQPQQTTPPPGGSTPQGFDYSKLLAPPPSYTPAPSPPPGGGTGSGSGAGTGSGSGSGSGSPWGNYNFKPSFGNNYNLW